MRRKRLLISIEVIPRHVHLSQKTWEILFGKKKLPQIFKTLWQRGQVVYQESITIVGPKGRLEDVRVLGGHRRETQVEISETEALLLGIKPLLRLSGRLSRTPGCTLIGPVKKNIIKKGVIVPLSHLHLNLKEANFFGLRQGQEIEVGFWQDKKTRLKVVVRLHPSFRAALHITTETAAKYWLASGEKVVLEKEL